MFPGLAIYVFAIIIPVFYAIYISLFEWRGINNTYVGLENYITLLKDEDFWFAFRNNIIIVANCVVGQLGISFLLAILLSSKNILFNNFHRTVIFLPVVLSAVVVGLVWTLVYNKNIGIMATIFNEIGLSSLIFPWLDDPNLVLFGVSFPLIWQYIGLFLIIWLSGIQNISESVIESAELDGATGWKKIRYIYLPLLKSTLLVNMMLCISGNMKVFDHIYVMTYGGPGKSSTVMAQYAYTTSFNMFKFGYGSALSIGMMILTFSIILIIRRIAAGKDKEEF
jgi:raffinose/stachyose/melibiose transport system permease protein